MISIRSPSVKSTSNTYVPAAVDTGKLAIKMVDDALFPVRWFTFEVVAL